MTFQSLQPLWPELFLACAGMILLVIGVLSKKENPTRSITLFTMMSFVAVILLLIVQPASSEPILNGMFVQNEFTIFIKLLIALGIIACLALSPRYLERSQIAKFEYPILILFAGLGMMMMVSANDLLALYMGLELQSLSLYVLAAIRRNHIKSAESGMKYFILGAISSGMLLFGISMIYGFTGSTNFDVIATTLLQDMHLGAVIGFVFVLSALAFKISAVPFHMWTPDVYEGAPSTVTAFFAIVPKVAAIALIIRLLYLPFVALEDQWFEMVWLLSFASMTIGAFAALRQDNLKRLLAYSSIGNVGYVLIGVVAGGEAGISAVLIYLTIYMIMTIGTFGILLCLERDGMYFEKISDLSGLSRNHPFMAYSLTILMFSMSGIPPFAGFFGKLIIFQSAISSGLFILAVLGVLTSVVAAYYYLRVIKVMFFDEPVAAYDIKDIEWSRKLVITGSIAFVALFIFFPSFVVNVSNQAVSGIF
ncbi:MAG: NADH-quinone oxidoreductase subunit NuoN [Pseudomonadota bacterium]